MDEIICIKAVVKHLETLHEPYKTQSLDNYKKFPLNIEKKIPSLRDSINSFNWHLTPEGTSYWNNFWDSIIVINEKSKGVVVTSRVVTCAPRRLYINCNWDNDINDLFDI